jgi:beta-lactamase regulating signal transducer with metallopeptidase domain
MNWDIFIASKMVENIGWTLLNSLWQIALISGFLFAILRLLKTRSANLRYAASVLALVVSVIVPVATYVQISGNAATEDRADQISRQAEREKTLGGELSGSGQSAVGVAAGQSIAKEENGAAAFMVGLRDYLDRNIPSFLPFAVVLWLLGIALFSLRLGGGIWQLQRYKTLNIEIPDTDWRERFSALCERLRIARPVKFLRSTMVETPIAIGFFKPLILVPASLFLQITPRELETIIAHELIHIRRFDPLVNMLQSAVEVLFFYHPGVWWISAQIRREREFAADAAVIEIFKDSHVVYARALANLEEIRLRANKQMPRFATAANGGNLMQRIQRILEIKTEMNRANSAWSAGLAVLLTSAVLLAVFSFNSSNFVNAQSKAGNRKIAIGFVSIPPLDRTDNPPKDADATARLIIEKLKAHKIPAIGFVQGGMISDGEKLFPVRANIVRLWRDAGFEIGIGGFKHISFYNTPYEDYVVNVERNESVTKQILAEKNLRLRYFSYPYLNTGKSQEDKAKFEAWLKDRGLTSVKYTIDNNEWMYSYAYDVARNDNDLNTMKEIRQAFLDYMTEMFSHHEAYSKEMFGRDIAQTMVLTPSRLVTDSADDLFGMIEKRSYKFVSMDEALADDAYKTSEDFVGKPGISWFERWTLAQGKRLRDEPKVDETVQKIWDKNMSKK